MINWNKIRINNIMMMIVLFLLPFILYIDLFINGTSIVVGDGLGYAMGDELLRKSMLGGEGIPLWNRYIVSGTPYLADIQQHFFYPFKWLVVFLPLELRCNVYYLLHLSCAGIFMYQLFHYMKVKSGIAVFGSIAFMFSNCLTFRVNHITILTSYVWLPLIVMFLMRSVDTDKVKYMIWAVVCMSLQFFSGFPQVALYSCIYVYIFYIAYSLTKQKTMRYLVKHSSFLIVGFLGIISIQLLPLIELMLFTGRETITYEYFAEFSYDLRELINIVFPKLYDGLAYALPSRSGFDLELYIGIFVPSLIIYRLIRKRDFWSIFLTANVFIWIVFASSGTIPFIGRILFAIPVLNSFRIPSRAMFLAVFSAIVLATMGLDYIYGHKEWKKFRKFLIKYSGVVALMAILLAVYNSLRLPSDSPLKQIMNWGSPAFYTSLGILAVCLMVIFIIEKREKTFEHIGVLLLCIICLGDVFFINLNTGYKGIRGFRSDLDYELKSSVYQKLSSLISDEYKALNSIENWNEFAEEPTAHLDNNGIYNNIPVITGYLTFNNPYYNQMLNMELGLPIKVFPPASKYIKDHNGILSMLSCRYIVQPNDKDMIKSATKIKDKSLVFDEENDQPIVDDEVFVFNKLFNAKPKVKYQYEVEVSMNKAAQIAVSYVDFYTSQQGSLAVDSLSITEGGENVLTGYIELEEEPSEDIYFRVVLMGTGDIAVKGIRLFECETEVVNSPYKRIYRDENHSIYENTNAKPILYTPQSIRFIENRSFIASRSKTLSLDEVSYIEERKEIVSEYTPGMIHDIEVKGNSVSGYVKSKGMTFVNMSQCYYPGWSAYVDGENVKLYKVNDVIQGCFVESGEHKIEFRFLPKYLYLGIGLFFITIAAWFVILHKEKNK